MSRIGYQSGSHPLNNVLSFLDRNREEHPDKVVLQWAKPESLRGWDGNLNTPLIHDEIRIGPFSDGIGRVAQGFKELGINKGDRAILFLPMSVGLYTAMFALQRIGAIPVFLDSWARRGHLGVSAQVVTPTAMISFEKAFDLCADVPELANIPIRVVAGPRQAKYTASLEQLFQTPKIAPIEAVQQEDTALVTFTTGSSGTPKGANRTHRFLAAQHYALDKSIPYLTSDVDLPVFPIFSLNNLASGVTTVIPALDVGVPGPRDALLLLAQIRSCKVNCTTLSPSLLNSFSVYCLENKIEVPEFRRVITGGAPVSRDNLIDFRKIAPKADIWVLFGSTEVEPMAEIEAKEMIDFKTRASEDPEWVDEGVNVGHFAEGLEARFIHIQKGTVLVKSADDWKALEVPKGQVGELIVAGEHVCRDYFNNEEAFFRAKIRDERGVVWHRTGDLGRIDEKGYLWIVGRVHNAIQRGGEYAFPVRAEIILKKLSFVKTAAYLGLPDTQLGEKTCAVVVPQDLRALDNPGETARYESEIRRIMTKNGMPVDQVIIRKEIPLDPRHHSKVEYDLLRERLLKGE